MPLFEYKPCPFQIGVGSVLVQPLVDLFFARHFGQPTWGHYVGVSHPLRVQKARVSNHNGFKLYGEAKDVLIAEVNVLHVLFPIKSHEQFLWRL